MVMVMMGMMVTMVIMVIMGIMVLTFLLQFYCNFIVIQCNIQRLFGLTTLCNGSAKNRVRSCRRHAIRQQRAPTVQNITLLTNKSLVSVRNSNALFMFVFCICVSCILN